MHDNNLNLIQKTMASAEYIANVMAGLEQFGAAIKAREEASSGRAPTRGEQVLEAAIQTGAVSPVRPVRRSPSKKRKKKMSKAARAKMKADLKVKTKAKDLEKKRGYEYGSWNLFVLIIQLLGIHKLIPDAVVSSYTQAKIAKGLKYNEGMGRSNLLKMVLSIIYHKHEKGAIAEIKQAACEDAAVDKLTKGAVDDLIDEAWAASLETAGDSDTFKALFDEARAACEACEIPTDDETDEADEDDEAD